MADVGGVSGEGRSGVSANDRRTAPSDSGSGQFEQAAQRIVNWLAEHTEVAQWTVSRIHDGQQTHLHTSGSGPVAPGSSFLLPETLCRRMIAGAPGVVADTRLDLAYSDLPMSAHVVGYVGVPITDEHGNLFGALCGLDSRPLRQPSGIDMTQLGLLSGLLTDVLASARELNRAIGAAAASAALAERDPLTGVWNRRGWDLVSVSTTARNDALGESYAVVVVDLDELKSVNDTGGHQAGDELLVRAATTLTAAVRDTDVVARLGGDEFAVILNDCRAGDAVTRVENIRQALEHAQITASVGLAAAPPKTPVPTVLADADKAMYAEKRRRDTRQPES